MYIIYDKNETNKHSSIPSNSINNYKNSKSVHNRSYIFSCVNKIICEHTVFFVKLL